MCTNLGMPDGLLMPMWNCRLCRWYALRIVFLHSAFQGPVRRRNRGAVVVGGAGHRCGERRRLEGLPHDVHLGEFAGRQQRDAVADVGQVGDEALGDQCLEAFADRDRTDPEHRRDVVDRNGRPGWRAAFEDHPAHLVDDCALRGVRPAGRQPCR